MNGRILQVADKFWNIRGSYKIRGIIDVGTQASLVGLASGKFVMLDSFFQSNNPVAGGARHGGSPGMQ